MKELDFEVPVICPITEVATATVLHRTVEVGWSSLLRHS
jgi:hypothetical protein